MNSKILLGFALALVLAAPAWAFDDFPPPWPPGPNDNLTSAVWEFWGNPPGTKTPVRWHNPGNQPPGFTPRGAQPGFDPDGPGSTGVNTWKVTEPGGGFDLFLPNYINDNPLKIIQLQVTSDQPPLGPPTSSPPASSSTLTGTMGHGPSQGGAWVNYNYVMTIQPNPDFEIVSVSFPVGTDIGEIDVRTNCTVPEPGTAALLLMGAPLVVYGTVRRCRRR